MFSITLVSRLGADLEQEAPATTPLKKRIISLLPPPFPANTKPFRSRLLEPTLRFHSQEWHIQFVGRPREKTKMRLYGPKSSVSEREFGFPQGTYLVLSTYPGQFVDTVRKRDTLANVLVRDMKPGHEHK